jgi:hypothetical protein
MGDHSLLLSACIILSYGYESSAIVNQYELKYQQALFTEIKINDIV